MEYNKYYYNKAFKSKIYNSRICNNMLCNNVKERIFKGIIKREECKDNNVFSLTNY